MQLTVLCCGDFDLSVRCVLRQDPVFSTLCSGDEGLQACVAWGVAPADVLSAVARSRCQQRVDIAVFKALYGDGVCRYPFLCCLSSVLFQAPEAPVEDEQSKEEDDLSAIHCNFIFFASFCVKLSFLCTADCFS
jgi:hypothetical protein